MNLGNLVDQLDLEHLVVMNLEDQLDLVDRLGR
jgi:hypothetical protein